MSAAARAGMALLLGLHMTLVVGACHVTQGAPGAATPEQRFFDWAEPTFAASEYRARRERVAALLMEDAAAGAAGVLLVPSRPGFSDGSTFRQTSDFLYLTGLELPDSVLALELSGRARLFAPARDAVFESASRPNDFPGRPLADDPELARRAGVEVVDRVGLAAALEAWTREGRILFLHLGREGLEVEAEPVRWVSPERALYEYLRGAYPGARFAGAREALARARMRKSPAEVALLRRAAAITCEGIRRAAQEVRVGVSERELEAAFEGACKRAGAQRLAFDSIVKSGANSLWPWRILAAHYNRRNRSLKSGDLVIFDVGCELDHYASDVGRTFPASGRFDPEQRAALELSTAVADGIIAAVRPGISLLELQRMAEATIPPGRLAYMQTGVFFGHHIGLDVGDPSLARVPLEPGMVFTVEPWYYDHVAGVAVFVEDVVLVTEAGCEVLTASLPRAVDELERLVAPD